ncbi:alpha-amylase family glycosyl hydrolase [Bacillus anthracis]|nr:alpha-amylase family glycosyl hydrolase [Bacillus anthracis]
MGAFFNKHYMKRYTRDMVNNNQFSGKRWKLALTYLYTQEQIPIVYYGTEIAIDGGSVPVNQKMMNFRTEKWVYYIKKEIWR